MLKAKFNLIFILVLRHNFYNIHIMKTTKNIFILFAFLSGSFSINAQIDFKKGSWEAVKQEAKKQNKLIFIDFYYTGCAPCAQMDTQVFPNKQVYTALNKDFVSFKTDVLKEEIGEELRKKYRVGGFPTFIFLTSEGEVINRITGFCNVERFMSLVEFAKNKGSEEKS